MTASARLLIAGSTLSQLGNWVNVTAVMVVLQERHGAALVAAYFLARTVAPFFLARPLVSLVPDHLVASAWAGAQGILSMMMLTLAFVGGQTMVLLLLLAFAGVLQSATSSWLMQLVDTVAAADRKSVITAISTGISVAMVAGPSLGGLLALLGGLFPVFLFNAATFALSIVLVPWRRARGGASPGGDSARWGDAWVSVARSLLPVHPAGGTTLRRLAVFWIAFGLFGGFLTASETPVFSDLKHFGADQIGLAISAYGLGGLLVFLASTFLSFSTERLSPALLIVAGMFMWALLDGAALYAAFFVVGLGFSLVNSATRVLFADEFAQSEVPTAQSWAWVNQLSLLTSVVSYLAALVYFSFTAASQPMLVFVCAISVCCAVLGVHGDLRSRATRRSVV